jgi:hypothetical protein
VSCLAIPSALTHRPHRVGGVLHAVLGMDPRQKRLGRHQPQDGFYQRPFTSPSRAAQIGHAGLVAQAAMGIAGPVGPPAFANARACLLAIRFLWQLPKNQVLASSSSSKWSQSIVSFRQGCVNQKQYPWATQ